MLTEELWLKVEIENEREALYSLVNNKQFKRCYFQFEKKRNLIFCQKITDFFDTFQMIYILVLNYFKL